MSNVTFLGGGHFDVSQADVDAALAEAGGSAGEAIRRLLIANANLERRMSRQALKAQGVPRRLPFAVIDLKA